MRANFTITMLTLSLFTSLSFADTTTNAATVPADPPTLSTAQPGTEPLGHCMDLQDQELKKCIETAINPPTVSSADSDLNKEEDLTLK